MPVRARPAAPHQKKEIRFTDVSKFNGTTYVKINSFIVKHVFLGSLDKYSSYGLIHRPKRQVSFPTSITTHLSRLENYELIRLLYYRHHTTYIDAVIEVTPKGKLLMRIFENEFGPVKRVVL